MAVFEAAVFNPATGAAIQSDGSLGGKFLNPLPAFKGTLLIYNDSAYYLKFLDESGAYLRRVPPYAIDKIVLCSQSVRTIQWRQGSALGNAATALISSCSVDAFTPDEVIDYLVTPVAIPRLTVPNKIPTFTPIANGGVLNSQYSGVQKWQLFTLDYATPQVWDTLDRLTLSTASLGTADSGQAWTTGSGTLLAPSGSTDGGIQLAGSPTLSTLATSGINFAAADLALSLDNAGASGVTMLELTASLYIAENSGTGYYYISIGGVNTNITNGTPHVIRLKTIDLGNGTSDVYAGIGTTNFVLPALTKYGNISNSGFSALTISLAFMGTSAALAGAGTAASPYVWPIPLQVNTN